jgi:BirA family biotin operon repressor/biotin-[acetyl-CoA-carboxylase] ligase
VADGIADLTESHPLLKWPNDVMIQGKKVAGILTEAITANNTVSVIIGIGINVSTTSFPKELEKRAGSLLTTTGKMVLRSHLLEKILLGLDHAIDEFAAKGMPWVRQMWEKKDFCRNRKLNWLTPQGTIINGYAQGIDDQGFLVVRDENGQCHTVMSGDISPQ